MEKKKKLEWATAGVGSFPLPFFSNFLQYGLVRGLNGICFFIIFGGDENFVKLNTLIFLFIGVGIKKFTYSITHEYMGCRKEFNIQTFANHVDDPYEETKVWQHQIAIPSYLYKSRELRKSKPFVIQTTSNCPEFTRNFSNFAFRTTYSKINLIQLCDQKLRPIYD